MDPLTIPTTLSFTALSPDINAPGQRHNHNATILQSLSSSNPPDYHQTNTLLAYLLTSPQTLCLLGTLAIVFYIFSSHMRPELVKCARRNDEGLRGVLRALWEGRDTRGYIKDLGEFFSGVYEEEESEVEAHVHVVSLPVGDLESIRKPVEEEVQDPQQPAGQIPSVKTPVKAEMQRKLIVKKRTCLRRRAEGVGMGRWGVKGSFGSAEGPKKVSWGDGSCGGDVECEKTGLVEVIWVEVSNWVVDEAVEESEWEDVEEDEEVNEEVNGDIHDGEKGGQNETSEVGERLLINLKGSGDIRDLVGVTLE